MEGKWNNNNNNNNSKSKVVMDGSDIMKLVQDDHAFTAYVDRKFAELDRDADGKLSLSELKPAVADIGVALGLPAQGSAPDSDHIYSEVLSEFTHGKDEKVSKAEFRRVLSDILIGMAAGLQRDPVVILRLDGSDLHEYITGPTFETDMVSIHSEVESSSDSNLKTHILRALKSVTVAQGMPPVSDPYVMSNVVEPALRCFTDLENEVQVSQEAFLAGFKKVAEKIVELLREKPVIVAHSENVFEGSAIRRLLSNKSELEKVMNTAMENIPRDHHGKISKDYVRVAFDSLAASAGLPPYGAISEMDEILNKVIKMAAADDGKAVKEDEFKRVLTEILGAIMLQLEGNPISVTSNSVVHEPIATASSLLQVSPGQS